MVERSPSPANYIRAQNSVGLGIQWPEPYSPRAKKISCRQAVPIGSTTMDNTFCPSVANNERVDYCWRKPLDEQVNGEKQSQTPAVVRNVDAIPLHLGGHSTDKPPTCSPPQMTTVYFAETSSYANRARTAPEQIKRKRSAYCEIDGSVY